MTSQSADRQASPLIVSLVLGLLAAGISPGAIAEADEVSDSPGALSLDGGCGHCISKDDLLAQSQVIFGSSIEALNDQGLVIPIHGGDVWKAAGGIPDTDGDFLPDFLEHWLLATSVFVVDDDNAILTGDPVHFESQWNILVSHHGGLLYAGAPLLNITISSEGDHLALDVCHLREDWQYNQHTTIDRCLIESRELSAIEFGITPAGFWFEAVGPTDARELFFALDLENLGSETQPVVYLETGAAATNPMNGAVFDWGTSVAVLSNPLAVWVDGENVGIPPLAGGSG